MMEPCPKTVRELVAWLRDQIHQGVWPPATRLPPERTLAQQLGLHRSTVATAYDELQASGLVDRLQGSGTWVHGDHWGFTPEWNRYLETGAFRPTRALLQRFIEARRIPGTVDFSRADIGSALWPTSILTELLSTIDLTSALGYASQLGDLSLRQAIADDFAQHYGPTIDPRTVLITAGAQQALSDYSGAHTPRRRHCHRTTILLLFLDAVSIRGIASVSHLDG
jgi:DNA-binding transcriptional MocR family regulator